MAARLTQREISAMLSQLRALELHIADINSDLRWHQLSTSKETHNELVKIEAELFNIRTRFNDAIKAHVRWEIDTDRKHQGGQQ